MSLIRKLAGETIIYGMSTILPRILHFIVFTIYLTRRFPEQKDFGIYTDMYAYATIILVLLTYRMDTAYFRFASRDHDPKKVFGTVMSSLFLTTVIFVGLLLLFVPQLSSLLSYLDRPYYITWFALILGFDALIAVPFAKLRLDKRPKRFLFYRLLNIIVTVVLVLFFIEIMPHMSSNFVTDFFTRPHKVDYVFIANLIASATVFVVMIPEFFRIKFQFDFQLFKKMLLYSLPLVLVGIAASFNQAFAVPLQKELLGMDLDQNLTNAGIYAACAKLAILLNLFIIAFNYAAEPFFFNQFKEKDSKEIFGKVALIFTIITGFVLLAIDLNLDLIKHLISKDYHAAINVVPFLLFAYFFLGLYYNFSIWYKLVDKTMVGAIIAIMGAIITFFVSLVLLQKIGSIASAYAALACYGFMAIAGYLTGQYFYPIRYPIGKIVFYFILTASIVFISHYFNLPFYLNWLFLLSYLLIVWFLDKNEITALLKK